jgi:hypothetical protein
MLGEEIWEAKVEEAIAETHDVHARRHSVVRQSRFFLLLGILATTFIQLVFMKKLSSERDFQWSKVRKVIYMPKKLNPLSSGDFQLLSMLEVLYNWRKG